MAMMQLGPKKRKLILVISIFILTFTLSFLIWPAQDSLLSSDYESNSPASQPEIDMLLCKGANLDFNDDACTPPDDLSEKNYFGGYRYLSEIYGFNDKNETTKSELQASEAVRGSMILAIIVTGVTYSFLYLPYRLKIVRVNNKK